MDGMKGPKTGSMHPSVHPVGNGVGKHEQCQELDPPGKSRHHPVGPQQRFDPLAVGRGAKGQGEEDQESGENHPRDGLGHKRREEPIRDVGADSRPQPRLPPPGRKGPLEPEEHQTEDRQARDQPFETRHHEATIRLSPPGSTPRVLTPIFATGRGPGPLDPGDFAYTGRLSHADVERLTRARLLDYFTKGFVRRRDWRVGMEMEKMGRDAATGRPIPYEGEGPTVRRVLELMLEWRGGDPVVEAGNLIGIVAPWGTITLEPS